MMRKRNPQLKLMAVVPAEEDDFREPKTKVPGLNNLLINSHMHHCCKRCAKKRQLIRAHLPQELVFNILLRFSAQVLHDVMRHVCRQWNLVINSQNFIYDHLQNSTSGLMIQSLLYHRNAILVEMQQGCLKISKFDCGFEDLVWTSCNGLVLAPVDNNQHALYVINPMTKQRVILPSNIYQSRYHRRCALAFSVASMEYKVVQAHAETMQISVLTIGVDTIWRHIDIKHLSKSYKIGDPRLFSPLVSRGFTHWIGKTFLWTLNVETETIRQFAIPQLSIRWRKFLAVGSNISLIHSSDECLRDVWE